MIGMIVRLCILLAALGILSCLRVDPSPLDSSKDVLPLIAPVLLSQRTTRALIQIRFPNGSLSGTGRIPVTLNPSATPPTLATGKDGDVSGAGSFNGSNWYDTAIPAGLPLGNSPRTMCVWMNPTSYPGAGANRLLFHYGPYTTANAFSLGVHNTAGTQELVVFGSGYDAFQAYPYPLATWSHFCATYDSSILRLYLNANFVGSPAFVGTGPLNTKQAGVVELATWGWGQNWVGLIDEAVIYDWALSPEEIQQVYQTGDVPL
ncbi:MAG: LamG domain-containing protein [Leptospirales bacterium]|nr:LamG domain-containing protein [Leptospirales bacterium]